MPSERELEQTAAQLVEFQSASEQQHKTLTEVLNKYSTLMDDYKRLRSDYEEERDSRERYKQMARGQERNPFVLVLIDGDGYIFDDDLVSGGAEGGQKAAALLNEAMKASLRSRGLEHCRIMVRVYANVAGLSKALSKVKLAGPEKRSLTPFVASFNRSNDLFDFVDAGDLKENADFKIRAMFRQFVDNAQCRHIFFAGCHDVGYVSELTPHSGNRDRITLMRTPAFHHEFTKLGLRAEDFPNIFRGTPLDSQPAVSSTKTILAQPFVPPPMPASDSTQSVCTFYQKGLCRYGNGCKFLHVKKSANGTNPNGSTSIDWRTPRQNSNGDQSTFQTNNLSKSDNDFMRQNVNTSPITLPTDLEIKLPGEGEIPPGRVGVNKDHHRLDVYLPPTSASERSAFNNRVHIQKLCNNFHLKGICPNGDHCPYDHSRASPGDLKCLRAVIRNNACPRKGGCRILDCLNGHICQKSDCRYRGGSNFCKIPAYMHHVDLETAGYEAVTTQRRGESVDTIDENESVASIIDEAPTPPRKTQSGEFGIENENKKENEKEQDSDVEADGEGALLDVDGRPLD